MAMTTEELCKSAGLSRSTVQQWLECGFLEAENVGIPGGGVRRIFAPGQLERARLVKLLLAKGMSRAHLAGRNLAFPDSERFIVFDGQELHGCRDAATAITVAVRAKRWCSAVDLSAIRRGTAATESR